MVWFFLATLLMAPSSSAAHLPARPRRHTHTRATFYMYTEAELDHGWLEGCAGFGVLRMSTGSEKLAEVGLRHSLYNSPLRVYDPLEAKAFYVPGAHHPAAFLTLTLKPNPNPSPKA